MADHYQLCRAPALHRRIPSFVTGPFLLCHHPMSKTILITGGARSGKSVIAETKALSLGPRGIYIATAEVRDEEMATRVAEHQSRRGPEWITHAAPFELVAMLEATDGMGPRLVDCLTLWLTNTMLAGRDWHDEAHKLLATLPRQADPVVLVTNEVGGGIVPDNKLARDFRDAAGLLNQWVAAQADEVFLAVTGLPLKVK
jgi:adenosylcobinamide kinase / adenosylcobinamide-phosphate guanylyltransferase